ncbi:GIY-YIG nuclease family protein [Paenibacillus sp. MMS20-IR301]|uniref:GIY-YIG nuclease family protein n=1 Tax=Paenibacillus sp. MMS20-IR301 TaxID=2895946 RepID=UPI0028EBD031|nr:GIY-YIG nuclease family protein [Paenibacillus sp. MMS20-IR301]WNS41719.1 GIY-YIG nuclease family protein [Paenibacillus sp. MMS20-IR301]
MSKDFNQFISDPEFGSLINETFPINGSGEIRNGIDQLFNGTNLFGTIIVNSYEKHEAPTVLNLLNNVCNNKDEISFDSFGLYFFWDYYTKEIMYIGISNNLKRRFGEHNSLLKVKKSAGTKYKEITDYFKSKEKLGYSILVQSPFIHSSGSFFYKKDEEIKIIEGAVLEEYRQKFSKLPIWNGIGGISAARKPKTMERYGNIFQMVTLNEIGFLNAKSTLSEIAKDRAIKSLEFNLNVIRSHMYKYGWDFESTIEKLQKFNRFLAERGVYDALVNYSTIECLRNEEYLKKQVVL